MENETPVTIEADVLNGKVCSSCGREFQHRQILKQDFRVLAFVNTIPQTFQLFRHAECGVSRTSLRLSYEQ